MFLDPLACQMCVCFQEDHTALPPTPQYLITPHFDLPWPNPERNPGRAQSISDQNVADYTLALQFTT